MTTATLTRDDAMQIVKDLLLVCQKLKSNLAESIELCDPEMSKEDRATVEADLFGWVSGDKDVTPLLIDVTMGLKPLTGQGLMNLMSIAHNLCPALALMAPLLLPEGRELPEPDTAWCILDLSGGS